MSAHGTWLADADDLAAAGAPGIPPPEVRAGLRPGDMVELGAIAPSLDGRGADIDRAPVLVVESIGRSRYTGVLPDGEPVRFRASNVLGILGPEMSGIFDWLKKMAPPLPTAPRPVEPGLPALPPPPGLPMLPAPPEPPRRTFMQAFREIFGLRPPAIPPPEARGLTIFEAFRTREEPGGAALPTVIPPAGPPVPLAPPSTMFARLAPEVPGILERLRPTGFEIMEPERPGPLIVAPPKQFEIFKPEPETAEMIEARKEQEMQLRKTLFEPEPEVAPTVQQMFQAFAPEEIEPAAAAPGRPELPPGLPRKLKVLPLPPRAGLLPTLEDVTRGIYTNFQPIEELWQLIREGRQDPSFQRDVAMSLRTGSEAAQIQFETLGVCGGRPDIWEEVSSYFHIPWEEIRNRMEVRTFMHQGEEVESWQPTERAMEEILWPLKQLVDQAFSALQQHFAPDLPGAIEMDFGKHFGKHLCQMVIAYREGSGAGEEPAAPAAPPGPRLPPIPPSAPTGRREEPLPMVKLGDVIPPELVQPVTDLINEVIDGKIDRVEGLSRMVALLQPHEEFIKSKGFVIHYLAAVLLYHPDIMPPRAEGVPLGEVVPAGTEDLVTDLINEALAGRIASPEEMIARLTEVFEPHRGELEAKRVDPKILAEWIAREIVPSVAEQKAAGPAPREINLYNLLPREVADRLLALVDEAKAGRVQNLHRELMQILVPFTRHLENQEIDPTHLAYAIEATVQEPEAPPPRQKPKKKRRR